MTGLVVRVWKASGSATGVERYCQHFSTTVLPQLRAIGGFLDANVLVRDAGDRTEVVVATRWESIDSVKAFAGRDHERAVVEPIVHRLLDHVDERVTHFTVAVAARSTGEVQRSRAEDG
jgi:heme-degrading monooxygenase HmoA